MDVGDSTPEFDPTGQPRVLLHRLPKESELRSGEA